MPISVPTQEEYQALYDSVQALWNSHTELVNSVANHTHDSEPPAPDPEPDPEPPLVEWFPYESPKWGLVDQTDRPKEAYAPTFIITSDEPQGITFMTGEFHNEAAPRELRVQDALGTQFVGLQWGVISEVMAQTPVTITVESDGDKNVPLFKVEGTLPFEVDVPSEEPPPPPPPPPPNGDPPPDQTVVEFTDPPTNFDDDTLYRPANRDRVYQSFNLEGTNLVTLEGVKLKGTHSSSRYSGAIKPGRNTTIRGLDAQESERLVIELTGASHGVEIFDSTFKNNALNAIWAHAYHRNFPTAERHYSVLIEGNVFANNNTRNEALNWDAADVKLLHAINAQVTLNDFQGSFGEAVWYDSDAQGLITGNRIRDYMRAIHVEMAWKELGLTYVLDNEIDNCSNDPRGWVWHAAVLLSGSTGVTVEGNAITNSAKGKDITELGFDHSNRSPHHSGDRVHARYDETHVEWTGHNVIDQPDTVLYRGGYPQWHLPDTSTYNVQNIIDR